MNSTTTTISHIYERYASLKLFLEEFVPAVLMVERIICPFWYVVGFIGNPLSAVIWLGQRMRRNNSSAVYLGALSISDTLFLFLHLLYIMQSTWGVDIYNDAVSCEVFHFLFYIPQYLSTFLVLGFTAERYVAVCHPFMKEKLCTVQRAVVIVMCLIMFAMALSTAQIYIWTYHSNMSACILRPDATENDTTSFQNIWTWLTESFAFLLVPVLVLIFNVLVLREIFKISRNDLMRRQQTRTGSSAASTVTLLAVSFYLIFTQLSASITVSMSTAFQQGDFFMSTDDMRQDKTWSQMFTYLEVRKIIDVICLSHYACYFFIYCLTGKHFRKEVLYLITFHGKLSFFSGLPSKNKRKEQYSMVSTNGRHTSETYTTTFSTTM